MNPQTHTEQVHLHREVIEQARRERQGRQPNSRANHWHKFVPRREAEVEVSMTMRRAAFVSATVCAILCASICVATASTQPWTDKWLGTYRMQHSGWKGTLVIAPAQITVFNDSPNLDITYIGDDGQSFKGYGYVQGPTYPSGPELVDPVDFVIDNAGAAIGIRFFIDFARTPLDPADDPMFVGYLMDQDRMAGSLRNPGYYRSFGWYAVRKGAPGSAW